MKKILSSVPNYKHQLIEKKMQKIWKEKGIYSVNLDKAEKPFYNLMMFPYPSAEGLHVGNMYAFTGTDIYGRFQRMRGNEVFEPIGLDGFGIHSENYAIKVGRNPKVQAKISEENFYRQLNLIGNGFDWSRKLETYDPKYYKWTQWLFIKLFKAGLAYRKKAPVNYCPKDQTVLADEQVIDGRCERCGTTVEHRNLEQWFFRITKYADKLLENIVKLDWSEKVKIAQRNWIGKKEGIDINYPIENSKKNITVFTTRPDTNFGATFIALAPEHPLALEITTEENKIKVRKYIEVSAKKTDMDRQLEGREKTGVFTGAYAVNELNSYRMPIWVSDFVLMGYGTGALVGVPGHDKRDFEFARKYNLEIKRVVVGSDEDKSPIVKIDQVQDKAGIMINSGFLNNLEINEAIVKIMDYLETKGFGKRTSTYHLRDWLISRQRYWGPPIPMINCSSCGWQPVPEDQLPVLLPDLKEWKPKKNGQSPLSQLKSWVETKCPKCNSKAERETDVSDTFLDSSWYFFRYTSTDIDNEAFDIKRVKKWLPVTMYIGGAEHSVLHLLYSRFITMVLKDLKFISFDEPFAKFRAHGLLIKEGAKMSKSKGNVVIPDSYIQKFGADTLRTYLMFLGPYSQGGDFYDSGIEGMNRFLKRIWFLTFQNINSLTSDLSKDEDLKILHKTIKKVTEDISNLRYNTAIAALMEWYNYLKNKNSISIIELSSFLKLLSPFAPHMTDHIYQLIVKTDKYESIHKAKWPEYEDKYIKLKDASIAVQVNGKVRASLTISIKDLTEKNKIEAEAKKNPQIIKYIKGKMIIKIIYVPGKVLNFVVN